MGGTPLGLGGLAGGAMQALASRSPILNAVSAVTGAGAAMAPAAAAAGPMGMMGVDAPGADISLPMATDAAQPQMPSVTNVASQPQMNLEALTRRIAGEVGVDPNIAVRVGNSEGGFKDPVRRSEFKNERGLREPSYGPFQLLVGGPGTGFPVGLGNKMIEETGLDPRNPANTEAAIRYALQTAKKDGWRQWYGAAKAGVGRWDGISGNVVASGGQGGTSGASTSSSPAWDRVFGNPPATGSTLAAGSPPVSSAQLPAQVANASPATSAFDRIFGASHKGLSPMEPISIPENAAPVDTGEEELASLNEQLTQQRMMPDQRALARKQQLTRRTRYA